MLVYILFFIIGLAMMFSFFKGLEFISRYESESSYKKENNKTTIF